VWIYAGDEEFKSTGGSRHEDREREGEREAERESGQGEDVSLRRCSLSFKSGDV
jgi:hypothetical protein